MTREEFSALPYLLTPAQVARCGFSSATVAKYAEHGILTEVRPAGCTHRRYQKLQLAHILNWGGTIDLAKWAREKPLLSPAAVHEWTGYDREQIVRIGSAGGLTVVQPAGIGERKYRREEVGALLGFNSRGQSGKSAVKRPQAPSATGGGRGKSAPTSG